ncbi:hypothetical protein B0A49_10979 [Cryomyces minteri]|uniref:PARP-type domain-containing protein n=1 Tax=Cryomyces minteri TaxID=331657 RepID=A0A4V5ND15_9PEZI|nr:hypothetical protein B0A49_10979 [Cryomyces minteri]
MSSAEKRQVSGSVSVPKRRRAYPFENMSEEDLEKIRKDTEQRWARHNEEWTAMEAAEAALSPEERRQNKIDAQAAPIMAHLRSTIPAPGIAVQLAPWSPRGSKCKFWQCSRGQILPHEYRIAMKPGTEHWSGSPDFFHVECFEDLIDLSSLEVLGRIYPECQTTLDGSYLLDEGAKQAVLRWIVEQNGQPTPQADVGVNAHPKTSSSTQPLPVSVPSAVNPTTTEEPSRVVIVPAGEPYTISAHKSKAPVDERTSKHATMTLASNTVCVHPEMVNTNAKNNEAEAKETEGTLDDVTVNEPGVSDTGLPENVSKASGAGRFGDVDGVQSSDAADDTRNIEPSGIDAILPEPSDKRHGLSQALEAWKTREASNSGTVRFTATGMYH